MERERVYFRDRLAGDRHRLLTELDRLAEALVKPATKELSACMERARGEPGPRTSGTDLRRRIHASLSEEVDHVFGHAARDLWATVSHQFLNLHETHCRDMEILIDRIRRTAADLFEVPCLEGVALDRLEAIKEPRVIGHRFVTSFVEEAQTWLIYLLPRHLRARRFERQMQETIEYLVARNVGELRWTIRQNLEEAFREFQTRMEAQLEPVVGSIQTAVRTALDRQALREAIRSPELQRLEGFRQRLESLLATLSLPGKPTSYGSPV
jgi:hypothetical protein